MDLCALLSGQGPEWLLWSVFVWDNKYMKLLFEFWNFQYIIRMNYFVFASRYQLYVRDLNYVYAENLPDTTSWHKCQCICYIWGAGSCYSDWDVWCSWWIFVFLDCLHCDTSGDLSCSECSDILHGSLEAWWVVGMCSVLRETVVYRVGCTVVHLMMCLAVKCWDTLNTWVSGSSVSGLSGLVVWCSWGNSIALAHMMSCLAVSMRTYYIRKHKLKLD